jgi:hypothetical protein
LSIIKKLGAICAFGLAALIALSPSSALASGAGLPAGDAIYVLNWSNTLVNMDTSGSETPVSVGGSPVATPTVSGGTAFNSTNNSIYTTVGPYPNVLKKTSLDTGVTSDIGTAWFGNQSTSVYIERLAIDDQGNAYVISDMVDNTTITLYSLNLQTAELTLIHEVEALREPNVSQFNVRSIAYNPLDQKIYAIRGNNTATLFSVNLTGTTVTEIGAKNGTQVDDGIWGNFAFDSAGKMWSIVGINLRSTTPSTWATTPSIVENTQALASDSQYANIVVTRPEPASTPDSGESLANTGGSMTLTFQLLVVALGSITIGTFVKAMKRRKS